MPGDVVSNSIVSQHKKADQASDEREELVLTRQSSIRIAPVADILSLRQQRSTHGKGPLKLLVFWKLKLLDDLDSPSLSDILTAVMRTPVTARD